MVAVLQAMNQPAAMPGLAGQSQTTRVGARPSLIKPIREPLAPSSTTWSRRSPTEKQDRRHGHAARTPLRPSLPASWHRASTDQAKPSVDERTSRAYEPHAEEATVRRYHYDAMTSYAAISRHSWQPTSMPSALEAPRPTNTFAKSGQKNRISTRPTPTPTSCPTGDPTDRN